MNWRATRALSCYAAVGVWLLGAAIGRPMALSIANAQTVATQAAPPVAASAPVSASFHAGGSPLTLAELAALQRKKLEQDYYKKAALTAVAPAATASTAKAALAKKRAIAPLAATSPAPRHQLALLAVYGPPGAEKAEMRYDGVTQLIAGPTRMGVVHVAAVSAAGVQVQAIHAGRTTSHTLRPGQTLELAP